jgi:hypothetical protein
MRWWLIALLCLVGCSDSRTTVESPNKKLLEEISQLYAGKPNDFLCGKAMYSKDIHQALRDFPIKAMIPDEVYWCTSRTWVHQTLVPSWLHALKNTTYSHQYDCDDYSLEFMVHAHTAFRRESISLPIDNMCIAEVWYVPDYIAKLRQSNIDIGNHAVNMIIVHPYDILFIEPQTGKFIQLTSSEIQSIYFMRF